MSLHLVVAAKVTIGPPRPWRVDGLHLCPGVLLIVPISTLKKCPALDNTFYFHLVHVS